MREEVLDASEAELLLQASDPNTPPEQLERIAGHITLTLHADYARPTSGQQFLQSIGRQGPLATFFETHLMTPLVAALVANPNTPQPVLLRFAAIFPDAFLNNPALLLLLLENPDLFRHMDTKRLLSFLRHAAIPADLLRSLALYAPPPVQSALQYHIGLHGPADADDSLPAPLLNLPLPDADQTQRLVEHIWLNTIPDWLLERLYASDLPHIQAALANAAAASQGERLAAVDYTVNHQRFSPTEISAASRDVRAHAAESADPAILRVLSIDDDPSIRARVAANPNTPAELLPQLELDDVQAVRIALAHNPHVSAELLAHMARDYSWSAMPMRQAIASHPNVSAATLELLAIDDAIQVRNTVARNPHTPKAALQNLLERALTTALYDNDVFFHVVAMANPYTQPERLNSGIRSPYWEGRYMLARNPAATAAALHALAEDGNCYVRAAALRTLQARST